MMNKTNKKPFPKVLIFSFLALLGFLGIAALVKLETIVEFDNKLLALIAEIEHPVITKLMLFFSYIGSSRLVIIITAVIMVILYLVLKHRQELILLMAGMIGTVVLNQTLKALFHRIRPDFQRFVEETGYSFPSGHSMAAFSLYTLLAFLLWRHTPTKFGRVLLVTFSALMILTIGFSRLYLGVHFPSDVIGAYLLSGFWVTLTIWYFQRRAEKKASRTRLYQPDHRR